MRLEGVGQTVSRGSGQAGGRHQLSQIAGAGVAEGVEDLHRLVDDADAAYSAFH